MYALFSTSHEHFSLTKSNAFV